MSEDHRRFPKDKKEFPSGQEKKTPKKSITLAMKKLKEKASSPAKEKASSPAKEKASSPIKEKKILFDKTAIRKESLPDAPLTSQGKPQETKLEKEKVLKMADAAKASKKTLEEKPPKQKISRKDRALMSLKKFKEKFTSKNKTETKEKDKTKGRIYRSLQENKRVSYIALGLLILLVSGAFGLYSLYQMQTQSKLLDDLKTFVVPENPDNFVAKSHPVLIDFINRGDSFIPLFKKLYPGMMHSQKIAILLVLGELKNPEAMDIWMDALQSNDPLLCQFAARSLARLKEKAVAPLMEKWKTIVPSSKPYFLDAMSLTESSEVLPFLISSYKDQDAEIREASIRNLRYYKNKKEIIAPLYSALFDKEKRVAEKALEVWEILYREQILSEYAESLSTKTKNSFASNKNPETRRQLIQFMGILGLCLQKNGDNYISLFREEVRKAFREDSIPEKIAATYVLGRFQDEEMLSELILLIESDIPELSENVALSLSCLASPGVPQEILSRKWKPVAHVQKALGKILEEYSIYTIRLSLKDKAISFLTEMMQISFYISQENIARALSLYLVQPTDLLIFTKDDIKDFASLAGKLKKGEDKVSQYLQKRFSDENKKKLSLYDVSTSPGEEIQISLLEELNRVLCDPYFYSQEFFPDLKPWAQNKSIPFHRILLEKTFLQEIRPSMVLSPMDLKKPKDFIKKFVHTKKTTENVPVKPKKEDEIDPSDKRDPISRNIWYQLSRETQKLLLEGIEKEELFLEAQNAFLDELNQMMCKTSLYDEALFEKIRLTPECKALLNRELKKRDMLRLNRLLLQLVYPLDIVIKG